MFDGARVLMVSVLEGMIWWFEVVVRIKRWSRRLCGSRDWMCESRSEDVVSDGSEKHCVGWLERPEKVVRRMLVLAMMAFDSRFRLWQ